MTNKQIVPDGIDAKLYQSAQAGFTPSQLQLGEVYEHGGRDENLKPDYTLAYQWYVKAAERGLPAAAYKAGALLDKWSHRILPELNNADRVQLMIDWFKRAAESGHTEAASHLGLLFEGGDECGIPRNVYECEKYYRQAAQAGDGFSAFGLAELLSNERGDSEDLIDHEEARKWFLFAVETSDHAGESSRALGNIYLAGLGVPQDFAKAYFWLNISHAFDSFPEVATERDEAAEKLTTAVLLETQKLATEWFTAYMTKKEAKAKADAAEK